MHVWPWMAGLYSVGLPFCQSCSWNISHGHNLMFIHTQVSNYSTKLMDFHHMLGDDMVLVVMSFLYGKDPKEKEIKRTAKVFTEPLVFFLAH